MRASSLAIVLLVAIAIGMSCGPKPPSRYPKVEEITALWTQIRDWRREAGLQVDPRREDVITWLPLPLQQAMRVCPAGQVSKACGDVSSLADAICDNAEEICILADELGKDDDWAQGKCASAKASCRDAKKLACECSDKERKAAKAW